MAIEKVKEYLSQRGYSDRVMEFEVSSATVALAAAAIGCEEAHIAKTMSFDLDGRTILVVTAGDMKINNSSYKQEFVKKAKMLSFDEVESRIGHGVGGVCPFAINPDVEVFIDESLKRFETIYPAAGSANSAVKLTPDELFTLSGAVKYVNVCKPLAE